MNERWDKVDELDLLQLEAEMHGELKDFREASAVYAERTWARGAQGVVIPSLGRRLRTWATTGAAAAAVLALGFALSVHRGGSRHAQTSEAADRSAVQVQAVSPVSDEALLQQIQSDLSSGVPAALEPLEASSDARGVQSVVKR